MSMINTPEYQLLKVLAKARSSFEPEEGAVEAFLSSLNFSDSVVQMINASLGLEFDGGFPGIIDKIKPVIVSLIEKARGGKTLSHGELGSFLKSNFSEEEESVLDYAIIMIMQLTLIEPYKAEKMCQYHGIEAPEDKTHVLVDFADLRELDSDDRSQIQERIGNGNVTLFSLGEAFYSLELSSSPLDAIKDKTIIDLPYLRHLSLSGEQIEQINSTKAQLSGKIQGVLDSAAEQTRDVIRQNSYEEKMPSPKRVSMERVAQLQMIKSALKSCQALDHSSDVAVRLRKCQIILEINKSLGSLAEDSLKTGRFGLEILGRFDALKEIIDATIKKIKELQYQAGENITDYDLSGFFSSFTRNSLDCSLENLRGTILMREVVDLFKIVVSSVKEETSSVASAPAHQGGGAGRQLGGATPPAPPAAINPIREASKDSKTGDKQECVL